MSKKVFTVKRDWPATGLKAGEVVYEFTGCTYGLTSDDTRSTGIEHTAVTRNSDGSYPCLTVPKHLLAPVESLVKAAINTITTDVTKPVVPAQL